MEKSILKELSNNYKSSIVYGKELIGNRLVELEYTKSNF